MKSAWNDQEYEQLTRGLSGADLDLAARVYTSRLIGSDPDLVLHGGGNTSVKSVLELDGRPAPVIYIKGSGWDLLTIEAPGFPAVRLEPLLGKRSVTRMDDREMVSFLRANLLDPSAPNPSVEALLHAFLPGKFVDHTHATASLVLANQPNAAEIAGKIFGEELAVVPYVMPGFDLSIAGDRAFAAASDKAVGLFLVNHGLFTFGEDARTSYERMIQFTARCEQHLAERGIVVGPPEKSSGPTGESEKFEKSLREALSDLDEAFARDAAFDFRSTPSILRYSLLPNLEKVIGRGTATPDHVIRVKPFPLIAPKGAGRAELRDLLDEYVARYKAYFARNQALSAEEKIMLDPLPRVAIVPGMGLFGIGKGQSAASIAADLAEQTSRIVLAAEAYGQYSPVSERDLFEVEYWSLEQAKLKKSS